jgi:hypothetical protein
MVLTALTKILRTMQKKTERGSNPDEIKAHVTMPVCAGSDKATVEVRLSLPTDEAWGGDS